MQNSELAEAAVLEFPGFEIPEERRSSGNVPMISFGREICGDLSIAESREWLVTNGIGGYASGTIAGLLTRRYHGILIAALNPPLGRTLLAAKVEEQVDYDGRTYLLSANRWADGTVNPHGDAHIEEFHLEGTIPVWKFAFADALLEKRIWMKQGENTTYVHYNLLRARKPLNISLNAFVNYRDYHSTTSAGEWRMHIEPVAEGLCVKAFETAMPFYLLSDAAEVLPRHDWYHGYDLAVERYRGLGSHEDHLRAGIFSSHLEPGESFTLVATANMNASLNGELELAARKQYEQDVVKERRGDTYQRENPDWIRQLVLAADQFIVDRPSHADPHGKSIIAGYYWFGDWGRDTMISLPGLTLTTKRYEIARSILRTFARYVDKGMLPNRFPDAGEQPEYNTVDATLWYLEAARAYVEITNDIQFLEELFPVLEDIVRWHYKGTRYNIHVDPSDGLLYAGEQGVQLTWMDAKIGDWVVTPRIGKPIEVNALWYNALITMSEFARRTHQPQNDYETMAKKAAKGFQKFWNAELGYCYDVIDGPNGNETSLRPNQLFAVSLEESPLAAEQQKSIVDVCARSLLTSHGLRSLSPEDPQYIGHYGGDQFQRDSSYHQGTAWGWLLPVFVLAHYRAYKDPLAARSYLEPMAFQLNTAGLGTLSEISDGDPPFRPRGCIAQAWTVAEMLRVWKFINDEGSVVG